MPPIRHGGMGQSSSMPILSGMTMASKSSSSKKTPAQTKTSSKCIGTKRFDDSDNTFYKAVGKASEELTPRTANAGAFTRRLLDKEWNLLQEYDSVTHLLEEEANFRQMQDERNKHRDALVKQREEARLRNARDRQEMRDFGTSLEEDAIKYRSEEDRKAQQRKEELMAERRARDAQWTDMQQRKEAERIREKNEIDKMINAAKSALSEEEQAKKAKADKLRSWAEIAKAENSAALQRRQEKKFADADEDKRLMRIQKEMMDKAEAQRAQYFAGLKGKQESNQAAFEKNAGAELARRQKEEAERIAREIREKEERDNASVAKKAKWLENLAKEGVDAVQRQLDEQAQRRQKQKEEDDLYGAKFVQDAATYRDEEAQKVLDRRLAAKKNQEFLLSQMATHKKMGKFGETDMSKTEQAINRSLLHQAKDKKGQEAIFRNMQLQLLLSNEKNNVGSPKSPQRTRPIDLTKDGHRPGRR